LSLAAANICALRCFGDFGIEISFATHCHSSGSNRWTAGAARRHGS